MAPRIDNVDKTQNLAAAKAAEALDSALEADQSAESAALSPELRNLLLSTPRATGDHFVMSTTAPDGSVAKTSCTTEAIVPNFRDGNLGVYTRLYRYTCTSETKTETCQSVVEVEDLQAFESEDRRENLTAPIDADAKITKKQTDCNAVKP